MSKKKKKDTFIVDHQFLKSSVLVHFGSVESAGAVLHNYELSSEEKGDILSGLYGKPCNGMVTEIGNGRIFMFLNFAPEKITNREIAIISHECMHVAFRMLEWCGIQTEENEELLCMAQHSILEGVLNEVYRFGKTQTRAKKKI